ncbi:MAG: hypothetical protein HY092_04165 [Candidatus Kerfeldbacteria bacterium]|nr:hypothetical protein [Candidatus Kerfeldbacteria bacterium]
MNEDKKIIFSVKQNIFIVGIVAFTSLLSANSVDAGTLSCSVTTAAACTGTVIYRMSGSSNAHAELPSQSTAAYASNVVCCTGVSGLGTACSGTFATALKLSGVTNAHSQQNSLSNYANSACISVPSGGSVSIGYQASNCTGFDTTLGSMAATTNAHVGNGAAYTTKICGTATGAAGTLTVDIVDGTGASVSSPSASFPAQTFSFDNYTSTGTLGTSTQKIRVTNGTATPTWALTMAATSGNTALWTTGSVTYDFNSTAANGRLTVNPSGATITPQSGCTTTGLTLGSSTAFNQGVTDSITLLSAGSSAGTNCYWDLTSVSLIQNIPGTQTAGTYTISLTLTAA